MSAVVLGVALVVVGASCSVLSAVVNRQNDGSPAEPWSRRWVRALVVLGAGSAISAVGLPVLGQALGMWQGIAAGLGVLVVVLAVWAVALRLLRARRAEL